MNPFTGDSIPPFSVNPFTWRFDFIFAVVIFAVVFSAGACTGASTGAGTNASAESAAEEAVAAGDDLAGVAGAEGGKFAEKRTRMNLVPETANAAVAVCHRLPGVPRESPTNQIMRQHVVLIFVRLPPFV